MLDSSLDRIPQLATHVQWMNGIQLFVTEDVPLVHGHVVFVNSPWGLTAVSQQQFWPNVRLGDRGDGTVRGVLSVDISRWDCPGVVPGAGLGKTARECSFEEIRDEVWGELERWLNIGGDPVLRKGTLHSAALDSDIIPFVAGVPATNNEPLLVNDRGTWGLRPEAHTRIPNLFLAADYVRTFTDLATMEGANEAARRATNAILGATGSTARPCEVRDPTSRAGSGRSGRRTPGASGAGCRGGTRRCTPPPALSCASPRCGAVAAPVAAMADHSALAPADGERRVVTVVFCDLVNSTELAGRLDPEDLRDLIRAFLATCDEAIEAEGGSVAHYMGDGVLALFGAPAAQEDVPVRAVRAALRAVAGVADLRRARTARAWRRGPACTPGSSWSAPWGAATPLSRSTSWGRRRTWRPASRPPRAPGRSCSATPRPWRSTASSTSSRWAS